MYNIYIYIYFCIYGQIVLRNRSQIALVEVSELVWLALINGVCTYIYIYMCIYTCMHIYTLHITVIYKYSHITIWSSCYVFLVCFVCFLDDVMIHHDAGFCSNYRFWCWSILFSRHTSFLQLDIRQNYLAWSRIDLLRVRKGQAKNSS